MIDFSNFGKLLLKVKDALMVMYQVVGKVFDGTRLKDFGSNKIIYFFSYNNFDYFNIYSFPYRFKYLSNKFVK